MKKNAWQKKGEETKPCVFPFKWKGRQYHQCTDKNAKNGKPWCAVKVNNNNMKVKKKDQWICETGCPGRGIEPANATKSGCKLGWKGDRWCDDENNNPGCDYDGGDCCGDHVRKAFCTECQCKACQVEHWFADTWCDDGNNNIGCHFDGGDCCGKNVKKNYCNECQCKACGVQSWFSDGFCDDNNNNLGCHFDGADCCGDEKDTTYCTQCANNCKNLGATEPAQWLACGWCMLEECGFFDEAAAMACIELGPAGYLACLLTLCGAVAYEECIYVCD